MKFYGKIGFVGETKTAPGVRSTTSTERPYYGEIEQNSRRWDITDSSTVDSLHLTNRISIVSDSYLTVNMAAIRYVVIGDVKWKVTSIDIEWPRLILNVGDIYRG